MAIITFGGDIGSGKSTVAPMVAKELGYESLYVGGIFRDMAKERGTSLEEFYASLAADPALEKSVDDRQVEFMRKGDAVVQGRIAWFLVARSGQPAVNILLTVDPRAGAARKIAEGQYPGKSIEEVMAIHAARVADERAHYRVLYGIEDHLDPVRFDVVCDTTDRTPEEVTAFLLGKIEETLRVRSLNSSEKSV